MPGSAETFGACGLVKICRTGRAAPSGSVRPWATARTQAAHPGGSGYLKGVGGVSTASPPTAMAGGERFATCAPRIGQPESCPGALVLTSGTARTIEGSP